MKTPKRKWKLSMPLAELVGIPAEQLQALLKLAKVLVSSNDKTQ